jgi:drug/metabolite transporter (DMT)-like permease
LLVATVPVWTAIIDLIVYHRALSLRTLIAFVLGGAGLVCVVALNNTPAPQAGHELLGAALALAGALAFAAYLIIIRTVSARIDVRTIVTHTYTSAAVFLIAAAIAAQQPPPTLANASAWDGIFAMALISQLLGHTGMNAALRWFSPNAVGFSTVIEPVIGALLAFIVFHETLTPIAIAGAILALGSIAVVLHEERIQPA